MHQPLHLPSSGLLPSEGALPPGSRMPFVRNSLFEGRKQELLRMARCLEHNPATLVAQVAVATGLGGIGKSHLACEFAFRYGQFFPAGVFWLNFADADLVEIEVAACGRTMGICSENDCISSAVNQTLLAWQDGKHRLLIFDNCEEEELLLKWLSRVGDCRVVVTSRKQDFSSHLGVFQLRLNVLEPGESIGLLRRLCPKLSVPQASGLATKLGHLPLALHLTGCLLRLAPLNQDIQTLLDDLASPAILSHPALQGVANGHDLNVARAFAHCFRLLEPHTAVNDLARRLLRLAALLAPGESFPLKMLHPILAPDPAQNALLNCALDYLLELGLLAMVHAHVFKLHRLLAEYVCQSEPAHAQDVSQLALESCLLQQANEINRSGNCRPILRWLVHLKWVVDRCCHRVDDVSGELCSELGLFYSKVGAPSQALIYYENALAIWSKLYGAHPNTANCLSNLGLLLQSMGDFQGARSFFVRALAIWSELLGSDHPNALSVVALLNDLDAAENVCCPKQ